MNRPFNMRCWHIAKKLFFLVATLLCVACGNNKVEDENSLISKFNSTLNIHETVTVNDDGTITYKSVPWGGLVGSVKDHNSPVDWSKYEKVTMVFAEPTKVETQLLVSDRYKAYGKAGITSLTCNFDGQDVTSISDVVLQTVESTTIVINDVKLTPVMGKWKTILLRNVDCHFGDWQNGFVLKPELFAQAHQGDKLEIRYDTDVSDPEIGNWLIKTVYSGTETTLKGNNDALNQWGCAPVGKHSSVYRIPLTTEDVVSLKEKGAFVNGRNVNVTQCNLLQEVLTEEPVDY